ncbi:MAG: hypothetical protein HYV01_18635, partial [Deltaproteobacteria bacterium]|nr:hypothetical protein [Deltaproteobacteria bacterium]
EDGTGQIEGYPSHEEDHKKENTKDEAQPAVDLATEFVVIGLVHHPLHNHRVVFRKTMEQAKERTKSSINGGPFPEQVSFLKKSLLRLTFP